MSYHTTPASALWAPRLTEETKRQAQRQRRLQAPPRRRHLLVWATAAVFAAPAAQALTVFTGNTPVFVGSWFNGSFTEVQEFQSFLDWQGWCNARVGATCTNHRYWNVAGNWDGGAVPGAASEVRVEAGNTVRVGSYNSLYQGPISDTTYAGVLSAAGRVELYGVLTVNNASFADLHNDRDNNGTLITTGLSTISLLSSGAGRFEGNGGTTVVQAFTPSPVRGLFEPRVGGGHTLQFSGTSSGTPMAVSLEPTARFVNSGVVDLAGGSIALQGTATFLQLPVFVNTGGLQGSGNISGTKFENAGDVVLSNGQFMNMGSWGEHSGRFTGAAGSIMGFSGIGSAGHRFAPGSSVNSGGAVNFGAGNHVVQGAFSAGSVTASGNSLVFEGPRPVMASLTMNAGGSVGLNNAAGASIGSIVIDAEFSRLDVDTGAPLELQSLRLVRGSFNARAPVSVTGSIEWSSGFIANTGPLTVTGNWQLLPGDRILRNPVSNSGNVSWEGGRFTEWSSRFVHQAGAQFDIWGDFSSAGGVGGKIINSGTVTKHSGTGRSELAMAFDNIGGTVRSLSGTLALTGGGTHTDATFTASAGAAIELAGGTTFGGQITPSGRLHVTGGDFTLLSGTSYFHAPGNRFEVANVRIDPGAHLSVVDALVTTGSLTNLGTFAPSSHVRVGGDFVQQGSFGLNPGKDLVVLGTFDNPQPLTVSDALLQVDNLINRSTINVVGSSTFYANTLDNRGTLVLGPANGFPGVNASIGGVGNSTNSGTLRVDGSAVSVSSRGFLQNSGVISNEGTWYANENFSHTGNGSFNNAGNLIIDGGAIGLFDTAVIQNSGTLTLRSGVLDINLGTQVSGPGSFLQEAGVTRVGGRLQADGGITINGGVLKGSGTVEGSLTIGPDGLWQPGNSPGTMRVLGDADLSGTLEIEVATPMLFDQLVGLDNFTARDGATISFLFDPGFVPRELDSDSITWLSAVGAGFQPGVDVVFSGLPTAWSASLSPDGRQLQLSNDLAVQIPLRGSHSVPSGAVQFNALSSNSADYPLLDRLDNAGYLQNRTGASTAVLGEGELNNQIAATLVNRGGLSAQTLNNAGLLNNRSGGTLQVNVLNNTGALINEGSMQVLNDFTNAEGAVLEQRGTLQALGRVTNRGSLLVAGSVTYSFAFNNIGDVNIQPRGAITGDPGSYFWHSSGELRVDGLLAASDISVFGGRLSGNGRVQGTLTTFGNVGPGNSIGLLSVDGNLDARGSLELEIASATEFDRLVVTGNAMLNATSMYLLGSYRPSLGDIFSFLSVGGTLQTVTPDNWVVLRLVDPADASSGWTPWADSQGIYDANVPSDWRAQFSQGTLSITAVPEPGTWALLAAGLAAAVLARRRQPQHAA
jgi:hypothetical protein